MHELASHGVPRMNTDQIMRTTGILILSEAKDVRVPPRLCGLGFDQVVSVDPRKSAEKRI